jgi:hypothetical protein
MFGQVADSHCEAERCPATASGLWHRRVPTRRRVAPRRGGRWRLLPAFPRSPNTKRLAGCLLKRPGLDPPSKTHFKGFRRSRGVLPHASGCGRVGPAAFGILAHERPAKRQSQVGKTGGELSISRPDDLLSGLQPFVTLDTVCASHCEDKPQRLLADQGCGRVLGRL